MTDSTPNGATLTPTLRHNFWHFYWDVAWYGLLFGSTLTFLSVFATRLGASAIQVSLLTSAPAFINLLLSLPAGRWLEGKHTKPIVVATALWYRLGFLVFVVLPWLFTGQTQVMVFISVNLLMYIPGTVLAVGFNTMFSELVPAEHRAQVVGWRSALLALCICFTSLACGWLLDNLVFPLNYQIVFGIGAFGALMSLYHLWRLKSVLAAPRVTAPQPKKPLIRLDILRGPFGLFIAGYFLFYIAQYFPVPLFPLYQVHELKLTDGVISLGSVLTYAMMFLGSLSLARLSNRFGHKRVLIASAIVYGIYPLLINFARTADVFYWSASALVGLVAALLSGGLVNRLMEVTPRHDAPAYMALHNVVLHAGIMAGAILGPLVSEALGIHTALWVSVVLRLGCVWFLWKWS